MSNVADAQCVRFPGTRLLSIASVSKTLLLQGRLRQSVPHAKQRGTEMLRSLKNLGDGWWLGRWIDSVEARHALYRVLTDDRESTKGHQRAKVVSDGRFG